MTNLVNEKLLDAVIANRADDVKTLLEQGANPNFHEDSALVRPLHFAAAYDCGDVVPLLIAAGANLHATTDCAETALTVAKRHESKKVLAALEQFYAVTAEDGVQ